MAKYKVTSLYLGGLGNKIFKSGDEVTEKNFPQGNAEKLCKKGFLEKVNEKTEPKQEAKKDEKKESKSKKTTSKTTKK